MLFKLLRSVMLDKNLTSSPFHYPIVGEGLRNQKGKTPHLTVFRKNIVAMSGMLQGGLGNLATQCYAEGLIDAKQMATLTNADAVNTQRHICQVLEQIEKAIIQDPENLELFITSVLEPMGKYADRLIGKLRK